MKKFEIIYERISVTLCKTIISAESEHEAEKLFLSRSFGNDYEEMDERGIEIQINSIEEIN